MHLQWRSQAHCQPAQADGVSGTSSWHPGVSCGALQAARATRTSPLITCTLASHAQVDVLQAQLQAFSSSSDQHRIVDTALAAERRARAEAEERLAAAVSANDAIERELARLRSDLSLVHNTSSRANALAAAEVDNALNSVSALRARLAEARSDADRARAQLDGLAAERNTVQEAAMALQRDLEAALAALAEARAAAGAAEQDGGSLRVEVSALRQSVASHQAALAQAQTQLAALQVQPAACAACACSLIMLMSMANCSLAML